MQYLIFAFLTACSGKDGDSGHDHDHDHDELEVADGEADLVNGEAIYNTNCMGCHTSNGINIISESASLTDGQLADVISNGVGGMPPQAGLSDTDVRDVIGYIRNQ
ncbi:MAG: cytochrome c [Myxococcota bacterium]|nr:cytochrome c [Myxococcota bacterium]